MSGVWVVTWLTTREAAAHVSRSLRTIQEAAAAGELHGYQRKAPNGSWRFEAGCVDAWIRGTACEHHSNVTQLRQRASA